jgi:hypothetical protein
MENSVPWQRSDVLSRPRWTETEIRRFSMSNLQSYQREPVKSTTDLHEIYWNATSIISGPPPDPRATYAFRSPFERCESRDRACGCNTEQVSVAEALCKILHHQGTYRMKIRGRRLVTESDAHQLEAMRSRGQLVSQICAGVCGTFQGMLINSRRSLCYSAFPVTTSITSLILDTS